MSEEAVVKHQLESDSPKAECPEAKRPRCEKTEEEPPVDRLGQTRRQIEYYMSDENLQYDAFFQKIISANEEGWMPFSSILSCKRIQQLQISVNDIKEALKESTAVEVKPVESDVAEENFLRRMNNEPLPALTERRPRKTASGSSVQKRSCDWHVAGCLIRIENIPEEAGWESVKTILSERLPPPVEKPQTPEEIAAGKKPYTEYPIKFVSTPTATGTCHAYLTPFDDDQDVVNSWANNPMIINGQEVTVRLIPEHNEAMSFVRSMPTVLQRRRDRDLMRKRQELNSKPVSLGGHEFASIDHLKKCLKEVIIDVPAGKAVNNATGQVLRCLLTYHPNGKSKLIGCIGFKVDLNEKTSKKGEDQSRCFYVIKDDGSFEDFSLQKCFVGITRNPPFVVKDSKEVATKDEAATAETTTPVASEPVSEKQEA